MPTDTDARARWYALVRRFLSIFDKRRKTVARCRRCFDMRLDYRHGDPRYGLSPVCGCDGCCEMETFLNQAEGVIADLYNEGMPRL